MGTYVNKLSFDNTGAGEEENPVSNKFQELQVTIVGLATGSFTLKAKAEDGDVFEDVEGGTIDDLSLVRTLIIEDTAIDEISTSVSAGTAYTIKIKQTSFKDA